MLTPESGVPPYPTPQKSQIQVSSVHRRCFERARAILHARTFIQIPGWPHPWLEPLVGNALPLRLVHVLTWLHVLTSREAERPSRNRKSGYVKLLRRSPPARGGWARLRNGRKRHVFLFSTRGAPALKRNRPGGGPLNERSIPLRPGTRSEPQCAQPRARTLALVQISAGTRANF